MPGRRIDRTGSRRGRTKMVLAGILACLMLGFSGLVYAVVSGDGKGLGVQDWPGSSQPTPNRTGGDEGEASAATLVERCADDVLRAEDVVTAAEKGVSHWNTHIKARTDMIEGRISADRMKELWKRTRLAGPADQESFRSALEEHDATPGCDGLEDVTASQDDETNDCALRARAAAQAVEAAEEAMGDWASHLENMASFAEHGMSADQAQEQWVKAWRSAPADIAAYRDARQALADAPACTGTQS